MNCAYHIQNPVSMICISPHKCQFQRKICPECLDEHGVDVKHTVSMKKFKEIVSNKLLEYKLDENIIELKKQRMDFKSMLCQTETMLKKIWEDLSDNITQLYDMIEEENQQYINLINQNADLSELSYTDLERLVQILDGQILVDLNAQITFYKEQMEKEKNLWAQEVQAYIEKFSNEKKQLESIIQNLQIQQQHKVQEGKEDLYALMASLKNVDESLFNYIIQLLRKEKIQDCIGLFKKNYFQLSEQFISLVQNLSPFDKLEKLSNIKLIYNVIINIQKLNFNKQNYSTDNQIEKRRDLIGKITKEEKTIYFLKFLVYLTGIDNQFIQSGSNSLNLLVEMKVNLMKQSFENIKIKDTSLQGGNFAGCDLSGSVFENVDISGINLNGVQLFNCNWKNIKTHEQVTLDGHSGSIYEVCFSPDGTTIASCSDDKSVRLWEVKTGKQIHKFIGHTNDVRSVCFSSDGTTLASGSYDNSIRLWDIKTGGQKLKLDGHNQWVQSVRFSPDDAILASSSYDYTICLWNSRTGQQKFKLYGHCNDIQQVCFSPNGTILASCSRDNFVYLWNVATGEYISKLDGHKYGVLSVCFSPDGTTVASGSGDQSIRLWNVKTGILKFKLDGHTSYVQSICFSPDGTTLASGSADLSIRLWDVKTGKLNSKLDGHSSSVQSVCFSHDGTLLASSSHDNTIRLWDVQNDKQKSNQVGHSNKIQPGVYFLDDTIIVSGSINQSNRLWDVKTGKEIIPSDKNYKEILAQFSLSNLQNTFLSDSATYQKTILRISQNPNLEAQGALILKGEFVNQQGVDLGQLFKSKGTLILENQKEQKKN